MATLLAGGSASTNSEFRCHSVLKKSVVTVLSLLVQDYSGGTVPETALGVLIPLSSILSCSSKKVQVDDSKITQLKGTLFLFLVEMSGCPPGPLAFEHLYTGDTRADEEDEAAQNPSGEDQACLGLSFNCSLSLWGPGVCHNDKCSVLPLIKYC
ncbi:unnamed protein product [Leuciscus chuanchicus]